MRARRYDLLSQGARRLDHWEAVHCALGASPGSAMINVAGNSVSSSILPMTTVHVNSAPASEYVRTERVRVERLDDVTRTLVRPEDRVFLKLDVQGFENEVLAGASSTIESVVAIQVEVSFQELYLGQPSALTLISYIQSLGFALFGLANGFKDKDSGCILQADAFFLRCSSGQNCSPLVRSANTALT